MIPALFLHNNDTTRNDSCTSPPISFEVKKKKKLKKQNKNSLPHLLVVPLL